jgi:hypothetical protein
VQCKLFGGLYSRVQSGIHYRDGGARPAGRAAWLEKQERPVADHALALTGRPDMFPDMVESKHPSGLSNREIALILASQDRFKTAEWFMPEAHFLRDSSNRVSAETLGGGRVAAIRFNLKVSTGAGPSTP